MKNVEIAKWIERLPLAPEFRPTDTEFADPIAYISKIEKEASAFGICKVIPPLPKPSRKYVLHNLNKSLSKCPELGPDVNSVDNGESRAVFTTRSQELGYEKAKNTKGLTAEQVIGAKNQVWQSGEVYTLDQFEAKSKNFAKSQLGMVKEVHPLVIETMFWKAAREKPIYVEYANDVPGSGFGQPEGLSHYFRKRRRRRKRNSFDRNNSSSSNSNKDKVNAVTCSNKADKDPGFQNNPILYTETASNSLPSAKSVQGDSFSARKDSNSSIEMEGTAGWKLSNSPWNLQVIARSPGSLTKFMPDDIPGVTSPMVYVGMLFSWFAWHVEDHELHSLNYLHMGSPKTWYSVPGDYAFDFEEIIRDRAYGGTTDRLVALSRLGEKTTIISPQVIVASGIPCCRLVQNPGEFVVTFPRAYHIGFSHGFNCGEAANFATPNWLTVAREAAVRRAAMNYLPMLSHQQLLSLLTMSFISRIPRSLLPGVRSSRLRDRQKEEREFLVKRAFIEDILYENNLLTVLLQRSSSHRSVLWDAESLPSTSKESELSNNGDTYVLASIQKDSPENDDNVDHFSQLNEYIGAVGFDLNDDDLAYGFQIDSGTLPCVACGILGFPFMTVVQPSEAASKNLLHENPLRVPATSCHLSDTNHVAKESIEETKTKLDGKDPCHLNESSPVANLSQCTHSDMEQTSVSDHLSSFKHRSGFPNVEIAKGWNTSNLFLKPRIFCLCHALEIEALLRPVGGANVLVICHSDFQKIKAHVASIAEETSTPFNYNEITIGNVSQEDLHLIDMAIDRDEQVDRPDWTSQLSVNLQHYLKVKKRSPTKNVQYALSLGGLLCHGTPLLDASSVKWSSRKLRSNRHLKQLSQGKTSVGVESIEAHLKTNLGREVVQKNVKISQYSRRKYKSNSSACKDSVNEDKKMSGSTVILVENFGISASGQSFVASDGKSDLQLDQDVLLSNENSGSPSNENVRGDNAESQTLMEEQTMDDVKLLRSVQSDGDDVTEESSGPLRSSNFSDDNLQQNVECEESEHLTAVNSKDNAVSSSTCVANESTPELVEECHTGDGKSGSPKKMGPKSKPISKTGSKRKREASPEKETQTNGHGFVKSPCEGLRPRGKNDASSPNETTLIVKKLKASNNSDSVPSKDKKKQKKGCYKCDLDGCSMSFELKTELLLHKGNRCPVEGCRKKFTSHKYAILHQRVHDDDRPLKCPWNGCTMSFKWAWARIEHLRVHTGERPYVCKVEGCELTFRYISDFSRHRRKTGHSVT